MEPILRATMVRRHQFQDYGDGIPWKIRFSTRDSTGRLVANFTKLSSKACAAKSPPLSSPSSLATFTRRFQLKQILARTIYVAFSYS